LDLPVFFQNEIHTCPRKYSSQSGDINTLKYTYDNGQFRTSDIILTSRQVILTGEKTMPEAYRRISPTMIFNV